MICAIFDLISKCVIKECDNRNAQAFKNLNGTTEWYKDGELHRIDGPASIWDNGTRYWYLYGKKHREDGPAIEYPNGNKEWYLHGKHHRLDGPAVIFNGDKYWFFDDIRHREDGPAIIRKDGYEGWFIDGKRHREDGPAITLPNGNIEWHYKGCCYGINNKFTKQSWIKKVEKIKLKESLKSI